MKALALLVVSILLMLLSSCMMPQYSEQIAANESKLREAGYVHPENGEIAPDITAFDEQGNPFQLHAALENGPVLLFFYPANDTPNCANQLRQLSRLQAELQAQGKVQVYGINPAPSAETLQFLQSSRISLHVLGDPGLKISEEYGCASSAGNTQLQERSLVGIGQNGKVIFFQRRYFHTPPSVKSLLGPQYFDLLVPDTDK